MGYQFNIDRMCSLRAVEQPFKGQGVSYDFSPTRRGETTRTCERCGKEYKPATRVQKYCQDCRIKRKYKQ